MRANHAGLSNALATASLRLYPADKDVQRFAERVIGDCLMLPATVSRR